MAVKIRLQRHGKKGKPFYYIVAADARAKRDGRYIERLGSYNPNTNPATIDLNLENAVNWLQNGAQPTDTAKAILSYRGAIYKNHLLNGVKKGAFDEAEAEKRFNAWWTEKEAKVNAKKDTLAKKSADADAARLASEKEIQEARAQKIALANSEMVAAAEAEAAAAAAPEVEEGAEAPAAEAPAAEEAPAAVEEAPAAVEEAPAEEPAAEEAPAEEPAAEEAPAEEPAAEEAPAEEPAAEEAPAEEPAAEEAPAEEPAAAAAPSGDADDLKKIEGIGPKIAETIVAAGIATYADLAKAKPEAISEIIAGVRGSHDPASWPLQAQMAADGKWDELKKWQDEHDGGKLKS